MGDFDDFVQQGKQLSLILNGPSDIPTSFFKTLWDASEGGDPSQRVVRAISQLEARLEKGDVPSGGDAGGGGGFDSPSKSEKKDKKKKSKDEKKPSTKASAPKKSGGGDGGFGGGFGGGGGDGGGGGSADFQDFVQQGNQLSSVFGGPNRVQERYLRNLWDASEGGDAKHRVDRAINQLMAALEQGEVPADDGSGGGGGQDDGKEKKKHHKKKHHHDSSKDAGGFDGDAFGGGGGDAFGGSGPQLFGEQLGTAGMLGPAGQGPGMQSTAGGFPGGHGGDPFGGSAQEFAPPPPQQGFGGGGFNASFGGGAPQGAWGAGDDGDSDSTNSDNDWWNARGAANRGRSGGPAVAERPGAAPTGGMWCGGW